MDASPEHEEVSVAITESPKHDAIEHMKEDHDDLERKAAKTRRWGQAFYGDTFERYTLIAEMEAYLPAFRDMYVSEMRMDSKTPVFDIIRQFNKKIAPAIFYPRPQQYQNWRAKWDTELLNERGIMVSARKIQQVIKTKSEAQLHAPDESELELGARHLGGELVNDALDMLHRDQETPELYEPDELIKRRAYVLNVYGFVTKAVHSKESLKLKKSADARETAGFLMDIMRQGTSGKVGEETLTLLRGTVVPTLENVTPQN